MNTRLNEDEGRQGETGHNVRFVLAASLTGIIIVFLVVAVLV